MSEILANIVVEQTELNFQPDVNSINVTPEAINLNIFTTSAPGAGQSSNTELLFNNQNLIDGVPFTSYNGTKLTLGSPSNISITGGTNGYVLQTDGTGNLSWTAQTGGGGNGSPGGSNTQIQYNDGGLFGGTVGFTFDKTTNTVSMPGNLIVATDITANGNIYGYVANANYANFAGNVANANYAAYAGNVTIAAQPNITSTGNLTSLNVDGNIVTTGTTKVQQAIEKVFYNAGGANATVNFDLLDQAILYYAGNASGAITLNIRGNSTVSLNTVMNNYQSMTCTFLNTNGFPSYYVTSLQIDGIPQTIKWNGGTAPTAGTTNAIDSYTFNIIKSGSNTYTVFGITGAYY